MTQPSHENNRGVMSSNTGSSKNESKTGQNETLTELTEEFYKGEEEPELTGHTALQSDSQAIYVSVLKAMLFLFTLWRNQRYPTSEKMWKRYLLHYVVIMVALQDV